MPGPPAVINLTEDSDASELDADDFDDVPLETSEAPDALDDVEVDAHPYAMYYTNAAEPESVQDSGMQIVLEQEQAPNTPKKRGVQWTSQDRKNRVLVHQISVLSLLAAARMRNQWCNDIELRDTLQDMVPEHLVQKLFAIHPRREPERRERVRMFEGFVHDLVQWWASRFRLTDVSAAAWRQPSQELLCGKHLPPETWVDGWITESPAARMKRQRQVRKSKSRGAMEIAIFPPGAAAATPTYLRLLPPPDAHSLQRTVAAAKKMAGCRETSAILFCAMCRALGVPARLVVSLQPPPASIGAAKSQGTRKPALAQRSEEVTTSDEDDFEPLVRLRGSRALELERAQGAKPYYIEPVDTRTPPTVWVELFSKPYQHWITVDPVRALVRPTGNKHMEPLATNRQNKLMYVVGFEEDGYARDVTARYTRVLNSKVVQQRPEAPGRTKGHGVQEWWPSVVRALHRPQKLDRDAAEDAELQDNAAREPMPSSVGSFKNHPVYILDKFLRRDQVIHPPNRVGTFQGMPVYLRANLVHLQSARQWYNEGRTIKEGEHALKWVKTRGYTLYNKRVEEQAMTEHGQVPTEGLYAYTQTTLYTPPPVQDGKVPKNAFGNVDLYVPSMLPAGGVHIAHTAAAKVCRSLGVAYADAVVGFEFRKFRSIPRMLGVVVPSEHAASVWKAIGHAAEQEKRAELQKRQARALKGWKHLLTALTVARHIEEQYRAPQQAAPSEKKRVLNEAQAERQLRDDVPALKPMCASPLVPPPSPPPSPPREKSIVSLDELMAKEDARPSKRRIVVRRSTPEVRPARKSTRRAAANARGNIRYMDD
ncbi:hypothetical protein MVES_003461 [Malassezia vespertilionis]|uniref:Rad4p n=1 Tax=Malassezia vespertilionis TaxID=2020962 RepID=A0A2N1J7W8_9BASI|nr:hypothetical protein MVES_003461 [Malassezia vespertilionis]